jgi:hypothetical protein
MTSIHFFGLRTAKHSSDDPRNGNMQIDFNLEQSCLPRAVVLVCRLTIYGVSREVLVFQVAEIRYIR